jgi:hypothetical protein
VGDTNRIKTMGRASATAEGEMNRHRAVSQERDLEGGGGSQL